MNSCFSQVWDIVLFFSDEWMGIWVNMRLKGVCMCCISDSQANIKPFSDSSIVSGHFLEFPFNVTFKLCCGKNHVFVSSTSTPALAVISQRSRILLSSPSWHLRRHCVWLLFDLLRCLFSFSFASVSCWKHHQRHHLPAVISHGFTTFCTLYLWGWGGGAGRRGPQNMSGATNQTSCLGHNFLSLPDWAGGGGKHFWTRLEPDTLFKPNLSLMILSLLTKWWPSRHCHSRRLIKNFKNTLLTVTVKC